MNNIALTHYWRCRKFRKSIEKIALSSSILKHLVAIWTSCEHESAGEVFNSEFYSAFLGRSIEANWRSVSTYCQFASNLSLQDNISVLFWFSLVIFAATESSHRSTKKTKDIRRSSRWVAGKNHEFFACKNIYSFVFDMTKFEYASSITRKQELYLNHWEIVASEGRKLRRNNTVTNGSYYDGKV